MRTINNIVKSHFAVTQVKLDYHYSFIFPETQIFVVI